MQQGSDFKRTEVLARPRKRTMRAYQGTSTMGAAALLRSGAPRLPRSNLNAWVNLPVFAGRVDHAHAGFRIRAMK